LRDGTTVTTIGVPYCSASIERFFDQPFLISWAEFGSSSPL